MEKTFELFAKPESELVKEYVENFDYYKVDGKKTPTDDYYKDETLKRFFSLYPKNTSFYEILAKVTLLNSFYSTQIKNEDLVSVARDIIELQIDKKIDKSDISAVNEIAYNHNNYKSGNLYSFASKYCSFHNPDRFPIVDSYTKGMLYYMNEYGKENRAFRFFNEGFTQKNLNNYLTYVEIYKEFIKKFDLDLNEFSYKEIDKYLWKYAKEKEKDPGYIIKTKIEETGTDTDPQKNPGDFGIEKLLKKPE